MESQNENHIYFNKILIITMSKVPLNILTPGMFEPGTGFIIVYIPSGPDPEESKADSNQFFLITHNYFFPKRFNDSGKK